MVTYLRQMLLIRIARELGCNKVVSGETASMSAIKVIAETAKVSVFLS